MDNLSGAGICTRSYGRHKSRKHQRRCGQHIGRRCAASTVPGVGTHLLDDVQCGLDALPWKQGVPQQGQGHRAVLLQLLVSVVALHLAQLQTGTRPTIVHSHTRKENQANIYGLFHQKMIAIVLVALKGSSLLMCTALKVSKFLVSFVTLLSNKN